MVREEQNVPAEFQCESTPFPVDDETRAIIFQVVRELMGIAVRHALAKKIDVSLSMKKGNIVVKVEDDGIGFDLDMIVRSKGSAAGCGLLNARRRIEHLGGIVQIDTEPGHGTCITLTAPLREGRFDEFQRC